MCHHSCRPCAQNLLPGNSHADSCTPKCSHIQGDPFPLRPHGVGSLAAYRHGLEGGHTVTFWQKQIRETMDLTSWCGVCFLRMHSGWVPLHIRSGWHVLDEDPWIRCPGWHWNDTTLPTCGEKNKTYHTVKYFFRNNSYVFLHTDYLKGVNHQRLCQHNINYSLIF